MAGEPRVLIDLNILIDVLQRRMPVYETSAGVLAAAESGRIDGYLAAHCVTTLFYLTQKDRSIADARAVITRTIRFLKVLPIDQNTIEQALTLEFRDLEDAVQMISALQNKMDYLVTRNVKDYQPPMLPVMEPAEFLATLQS